MCRVNMIMQEVLKHFLQKVKNYKISKIANKHFLRFDFDEVAFKIDGEIIKFSGSMSLGLDNGLNYKSLLSIKPEHITCLEIKDVEDEVVYDTQWWKDNFKNLNALISESLSFWFMNAKIPNFSVRAFV